MNFNPILLSINRVENIIGLKFVFTYVGPKEIIYEYCPKKCKNIGQKHIGRYFPNNIIYEYCPKKCKNIGQKGVRILAGTSSCLFGAFLSLSPPRCLLTGRQMYSRYFLKNHQKHPSNDDKREPWANWFTWSL